MDFSDPARKRVGIGFLVPAVTSVLPMTLRQWLENVVSRNNRDGHDLPPDSQHRAVSETSSDQRTTTSWAAKKKG
jgi:hypothetical protein